MDLKDKLSNEINKAENEVHDIIDDIKYQDNNNHSKDNNGKCPYCGALISSDDKFCAECGKAISEQNSSFLRKLNIKENKKLITFLMIAIICLLGVAFKLLEGSSMEIIKVEDMAKDYMRSELVAEEKYKGKRVKVTGRVLKKFQFGNSTNYCIVIYDTYDYNSRKKYSVVVDLKADDVNIVNKLENPKFLVVEGKCVGKVPQDDVNWVSVQISGDRILF